MTRVEAPDGEQASTSGSGGDGAGEVVVGVDGSEAAAHALQWAVHNTSFLGLVRPTLTYEPPLTFDSMTLPPTGAELALARNAASERLREIMGAEDPLLVDRAQVVKAHPGVGLVEAAADADLLVVGTSGHSALAGVLIGSVSAYCVNHSTVPVALVPPEWPATRRLSTVVVGVDGSPNAKRALQWVVEHLAPNLGPDGRILAVGAFSIWAYAEADYEAPLTELEAGLTETVSRAVAEVAGPTYDGPPIEIVVEARDPRAALPDITEDRGDLLVIGARGVSGLDRLLLGSVASALVHHPTVPTVVIPVAGDDRSGTD